MSEPQRFIFDSSALLQHPEMLARVGRRKIVVPEAVARELSTRRRDNSRDAVTNFLRRAADGGVHIAPTPKQLNSDLLLSDKSAQRLSGADIAIAQLATDYAERFGPDGVVVVTLDRDLREHLSGKSIRSITGSEFLQEVSGEKIDAEIQRSAKSFLEPVVNFG